MGLLRSSKTKDPANDADEVTTNPPLALAPDGDEPAATSDEVAEPSVDGTWVRLGADALWAGVLPDEALGSLPDAEDVAPPARAKQERSAEPEPEPERTVDVEPPQARPSGPEVPGAAVS